MNCSDAEEYISTLYDGEHTPPSAARHISSCQFCRQMLTEYSSLGLELRLAAASATARLPTLTASRCVSRRVFLWKRLSVPQVALAGLIACLVFTFVAVTAVRAQSKPLWFQFGYAPVRTSEVGSIVANKGYDHTLSSLNFVDGSPVAIALRVRIENISTDDVILRCRAVPARMKVSPGVWRLLGAPGEGVSLDDVPKVHYRPGDSLAIAVKGGGTVYLKGYVLDHQPRIAFGFPLEPTRDELVVREPVLTSAGQILGESNGFAIAPGTNSAIEFHAGSNGVFTFALHAFPGAVQGEVNWGSVTFELSGRTYRLITPAPIAGGDQPQAIWVRRDRPSDGPLALVAGPIPSR